MNANARPGSTAAVARTGSIRDYMPIRTRWKSRYSFSTQGDSDGITNLASRAQQQQQ